MAKIHLYIRTQVTTDDPTAIEAAVEALRGAVEAAGGDAHTVRATVERDATPAVVEETPQPETAPSAE